MCTRCVWFRIRFLWLTFTNVQLLNRNICCLTGVPKRFWTTEHFLPRLFLADNPNVKRNIFKISNELKVKFSLQLYSHNFYMKII
jgi:hypothetical protein